MENLLERLKARDPEAQHAFQSRVLPRVTRICRHYLREDVLAEQTAADILIDFLFRDVDKVRNQSGLDAYLRMMTNHRCLRVREVRRRHGALERYDPAGGSEGEMVLALDRRRDVDRLETCMEQLTPRVRKVLRLRFHHGMTLAAIGDAQSVSKQYIGRLVTRGLAALKTCMEKSDARGTGEHGTAA